MGLYDTLYIETPLPLNDDLKLLGLNWEDEDFQTRDLDEALNTYHLRVNGVLERLHVEGDWVENKKEDDNKKSFKFPYNFVEKSRSFVDVKHHGSIVFYTSLLNKNDYDWWIEFTALFNNGVLQSITLNKCTKELASIRLEREAQWQKDLEEEEAKWHNVARKFLREHTPWSKLWLKAARGLDDLSGKVSSFIYRNIA